MQARVIEDESLLQSAMTSLGNRRLSNIGPARSVGEHERRAQREIPQAPVKQAMPWKDLGYLLAVHLGELRWSTAETEPHQLWSVNTKHGRFKIENRK